MPPVCSQQYFESTFKVFNRRRKKKIQRHSRYVDLDAVVDSLGEGNSSDLKWVGHVENIKEDASRG